MTTEQDMEIETEQCYDEFNGENCTLDDCYPDMYLIPFHWCPKITSVPHNSKQIEQRLNHDYHCLQYMVENDNEFKRSVEEDEVLFDLFYRITSSYNELHEYDFSGYKRYIKRIQMALKNRLAIAVGQRRLVSQLVIDGITDIPNSMNNWDTSNDLLHDTVTLMYQFKTKEDDMYYNHVTSELRLKIGDNPNDKDLTKLLSKTKLDLKSNIFVPKLKSLKFEEYTEQTGKNNINVVKDNNNSNSADLEINSNDAAMDITTPYIGGANDELISHRLKATTEVED